MSERKLKPFPRNWQNLPEDDEIIVAHNKEVAELEKGFKEGKLTYKQYHEPIKQFWLNTHKRGFIKNLQNYITNQVTDLISAKAREHMRNKDELCQRQLKEDTRLIDRTNWVSFFMNQCKFLMSPTDEDMKGISNLSDDKLIFYTSLLSKFISDFFRADRKNVDACQLIYEHYQLQRKEIENRALNYPYPDVIDALTGKATQKLEEYPSCPNCQSQDVKKWSKWRFRCNSCGRTFTKKLSK